MARSESISELYIRLGLQYDDLQSDFIEATSTIQTNMARLNRENAIIRLQAQVDISGLDEVADATQIFNIRTQALNRQIANQRDRVNMATAQLRNMADAHGENSNLAQQARIVLERERVALSNLERELQNLNDTQNDTNTGASDFLENLQGISGKAELAVVGLAAFAGALKLVSDAQNELIEKFRESQKQSYELNMPFEKTRDFLREIRLAGGDIGDFEGYIRGITDAYVKGEADDPEFIALGKYNAEITETTGVLKDFKDITEEVYQAWKKSDEAGEGIEFLQLTGGESGIRDAIQFFRRYEEAKEDAAKIFNSGIDPNELHESERALNLLTEQTSEFKDALADIATPFYKDALTELFEVFRSGTQYLVENQEAIQLWGKGFQREISDISSLLKNLFNRY